MTRNNSGELPIDVAIECELEWESGMKEILEATAAKQHRSTLYTAAYYGLQWDNHMQVLIESHTSKNENGIIFHDSESGFDIYMVAAMGETYDIDTVYMLLRKCPDMCFKHIMRVREMKRRRIL